MKKESNEHERENKNAHSDSLHQEMERKEGSSMEAGFQMNGQNVFPVLYSGNPQFFLMFGGNQYL